MAKCIPTTKSCETIHHMIGENRYGTCVQIVNDPTATHRAIGFTRNQKEWLKERLRNIGAKYIRFTTAPADSRYIVCYFALPITHEEITAKVAKETEQRHYDEVVASTKRDVKMLAEALGCRSTDRRLNNLSMYLCNDAIDKTKMISAYLSEPHQPIGHDEMRVYDIIRKAQESNALTFCVANADYSKMESLATQMNNKITNECKRAARKAACLRYGLKKLATCFT